MAVFWGSRVVQADAAERQVLHVSPGGDDGWSGRLERPNEGRTDGPLASLIGARDAVRRARGGNRVTGASPTIRGREAVDTSDAPETHGLEARATQGRDALATGDFVVRIQGGEYRMAEPLVLEPRDSDVTYEAAPGQRPAFSGGRVIKDLRQNGLLWEAVIPQVREGRWYFRQLFADGLDMVNMVEMHGLEARATRGQDVPDTRGQDARATQGRDALATDYDIHGLEARATRWQDAVATGDERRHTTYDIRAAHSVRRTRARSPNDGYHRIAELLPGPMDERAKRATDRSRFRFAEGDIKPFERLGDVNLILMHSWETSIHPLKSVDVQERIVEFTAPLKEWWTIGWWEEKQRYYVENARELLDAPGEWYLNRETGLFSYYPVPGETLDKTRLVAPVLTEFVRFKGDAERNAFVENITIKGLAFHHADWELSPAGNSSTQAAVEVPAVISADGARNCVIDGCEIAHIGGYAIWFRRGCKNNRIQRNRLYDLGAGGIRIGMDRMPDSDAAESSGNLIDNNHIFDGGRVYPAGVGIWIAQASHNRISHNDIHDLFYTGISVGWNWDDTPNRTHHNVIEFNHVHDLVHGELSDAGLIYCLGVSPGSVIRNNVFHDITSYTQPDFSWGIYLDATCGQYTVENNLVYNTRAGGIMFNNGGHEHVIRNNIFGPAQTNQIWPYFEKRPNTFSHNIVFMSEGNLLVGHSENTLNERLKEGQSLGVWDRNVYWHTAQKDRLRFYNRTFAEWQSLGLDRNSRVADPMFVDAARHDYRLRDASPAPRLGFKPFDISEVGLYGDVQWVGECSHGRCVKR